MDRAELLKALRKHPLLSRVYELHLQPIAAAGEAETYEADETIVEEGSLGDAIFLILSGCVAVHKLGGGPDASAARAQAPGRKVAELGPGEFFGEMCLVEPARRSATVVAIEPSLIFRLPNRAVLELAKQDPVTMNALLAAVIRTLSERLRRMNETLAELGQLSDWLKGSLV
jgi:CRP/FNR family transcriptional regulator, cyclic AMP receptor protein